MAKYYDMLYGDKDKILDECNSLEDIFEKFCKKKPLDILDIGCGTGNHSIVLAGRKYRMVGIDQSKNMIEEARKKSEHLKNVLFLVQDMKRIHAQKKFDCAFCLFNSFGYLTEKNSIIQFFSNLHNTLKTDSLFIVEFWNLAAIKSSSYKNWTKREKGGIVLYRIEDTKFEIGKNVLASEKEFMIINGNKLVDNFKEKHRLRCYTFLEMKELLENNNFQFIDFLDFDTKNRNKFEKPNWETLRVLAIAKKMD
jgi:SAM-dependent methyltransferase